MLYDANLCVADINQIFKDLDYDFAIRIIANNVFNDSVLQPILLLSSGVSDTSELFLRSYQLVKMFDNEKPIKQQKATETTTSPSASSDEVKVGTLARIVLRRLLESGAASQDEIKMFQTLDGSKKVFNLNFPLLVAVSGNFEHVRYYVNPLIIDGKEYRMTSQWFETQKTPLQKWIDEHSGKDE